MKRPIRLIGILTATAVMWLAPSKVKSSETTSSQTAEAPVEFIYGGITPDHAIAYKIKVNTDKPILEVHMSLKEMDASGKVLFDGDLVWQNIQHSTRQPIEQGKTYDDTVNLTPDVVKVECSFKEVVFKDYTRSSAAAVTAVSPAPTTPATVASATPVPTRAPDSPAPKASASVSSAKGDAESFVKSFYHDMEQDDLGKVMAYFDEKVDYYTSGRKDKAFIADQLRQYFTSFPVRSFSVGDGKAQASKAGAVSVIFEIRYTLRSTAQGAASTGRSHVEWDLAKRNGALKIVRFTGTSTPDATPK